MSKKQTTPSDSRLQSAALGRLYEDVLKLRQQVEAEQARAHAIKAKTQPRVQLAHAK